MNQNLSKILLSVMLSVSALWSCAQTYTWDRVNIGGGGYNTGVLFHPAVPDLIYARQDVSGLYRWDTQNKKWLQLADWMPIGWVNTKGCDGFAVDPSAGTDPEKQNIIYAAFGEYGQEFQTSLDANGVYRSKDRGNTWKKIWGGVLQEKQEGQFGKRASFGANTQERMYGERMAVDPANSNVLYVGTLNAGLYRSFDSRSENPAFAKIEGAPMGYINNEYNPKGIRIVLIDPTGGKVDVGTPKERSKVVYLGISSTKSDETPVFVGGVFRSTDGGETFQRLDGAEAPGRVARMSLGANGSLFAVEDSEQGQKGGIYLYRNNTWTRIRNTQGLGFRAIDVNPLNKNEIVAFSTNHQIWRSSNGGVDWSTSRWHPYDVNSTVGVTFENSNWTYPNFLIPYAASDLKFDPHHNRGLLFGDAFGTSYTTDAMASPLKFTPMLKGYETTVMWQLCAPPTGKVKLYGVCADVSGFAVEDLKVFPDKKHQLPNFIFPNDEPRGDAVVSDIEYSISSPSSIVAARSTLGSYTTPYPKLYLSEDNGTSWIGKNLPEPIAGTPDWGRNPGPGKVAISCGDKNRMVYAGSFRPPSYTTNAFTGSPITWQASTGANYYLNDIWVYDVDKIRLEADKKDPLRFYYLKLDDSGKTQVYVSDDGGATWAIPASQGYLPNFWNKDFFTHQMVTIKNPVENKGEVWLGLSSGGIWKSNDGARTFSQVAKDVVKFAHGIGFGVKAPDSNYPTLYVAGKVMIDGVSKDGVFLSKDFGKTFIQMTEDAYPMVGGKGINDMVGDPNDFGRVYIASGGTGIIYSTYSNITATAESSMGNSETRFNLYPNPATHNLTVQLKLAEAGSLRLVVCDMTGREVKVLSEGERSELIESYNIAGLEKGLYVVSCIVNGHRKNGKLLVVE